MSPRSALAEVNPAILRWARETAGVEVRDLARRFLRVEEWECGKAKPTVRQLEELSELYRRPLATFFLPDPPPERPLPTDFRVLPGGGRQPLSKEVRLAVRKARRTQRIYTELGAPLGAPRAGGLRPMSLSAEAENGAAEVRSILGVSVEEQFSWSNEYQAWRRWRMAVEAVRILVLQLPMPVREVRGFSLDDGPLPAIVVSSSDAIAARIFTLFHELAHVMRNSVGLCIPDAASAREPAQQMEKFCNQFAEALLVPRDALDDWMGSISLGASLDDMEQRLLEGAKSFKVSRYVILWRLRRARHVSSGQFRDMMARWSSRPQPIQRRRSGQRPPAKVLSQLGSEFVSLVLEAHGRGLITSSDVASYLSLNLKYLGEVQRLTAQARG